jgi:hypothetical protein
MLRQAYIFVSPPVTNPRSRASILILTPLVQRSSNDPVQVLQRRLPTVLRARVGEQLRPQRYIASAIATGPSSAAMRATRRRPVLRTLSFMRAVATLSHSPGCAMCSGACAGTLRQPLTSSSVTVEAPRNCPTGHHSGEAPCQLFVRKEPRAGTTTCLHRAAPRRCRTPRSLRGPADLGKATWIASSCRPPPSVSDYRMR